MELMQSTSNSCISIETVIETWKPNFAYYLSLRVHSAFSKYSTLDNADFLDIITENDSFCFIYHTHSVFYAFYNVILFRKCELQRQYYFLYIIPSQIFFMKNEKNILLRKSFTLLWCFEGY